MEIDERVRFLKTVSVFEETPDDLLRMIAENLTEMDAVAGEDIVLKGSMGDSMYFITQGVVDVHDGDHVFTQLGAGGFFGKYYLIDQKERSATVTAAEPCHLLSLRHDLFYKLTDGENTIVTGILRSLVARLREMNQAEEQLAAKNREIEKQKEELERQRHELSELNATKDKFFSIIAHDLRSPITTLVSLSDIIRTELDYLTPEQKSDVLSSLYDLSKNYLKLLDNLLQWSRMQTGRLDAEPVTFNLVEMITDVITIYRTTAVEKQVSLDWNPEGPVFVFADMNMARTILRNLISNALKYSFPMGSVTVQVDGGDSLATVTVRDNGMGMVPDMVDRLFHIDQTFSTKGTANEKGTGLGLILCKEFVEKNGGNLKVESESGKGSSFSFTLPVTK